MPPIITELWEGLVKLLTGGLIDLHGLFADWGLPGTWGLAIIAFTLIVKLVTLPLYWQQMKSQRAMQALQPEIAKLQKQFGKDKQKLSEAQMKLYKERGINPMAGCLPMMIPLPFMFALWQALFSLADPVKGPKDFNQPFLWLDNLARVPAMSNPLDWILPAFLVASQWVAFKITPQSAAPQQQSMNQIMQFTMPLMFGWFAFQVPVGLVVYYAALNVFQVGQQYLFNAWTSFSEKRKAEQAVLIDGGLRLATAGENGQEAIGTASIVLSPSQDGRDKGDRSGKRRDRRRKRLQKK